MPDLTEHLAARIALDGPLTVADYMSECLLHPTMGYYTTRDPLGKDGDFTTAPEISQMFGEMIGLCIAQTWLSQGAPSPFILAELGPGRGTLMADILRATKSVPNFHAAARIHLVEASEPLRTRQSQALDGYEVEWHDYLNTLPALPLFLVANEFFDALPIRQFIRDKDDQWRERRVGIANDSLCFGLSEPQKVPALQSRIADTKSGDMVEICAAASAIASEIAERIASDGGAAILIDYGDWESLGDTLQAVKNHEKVSPLLSPGQADLTAHVDFNALSSAASKCNVSQMIPQGVFLERLGITPRAQKLAQHLSGTALTNHIAAHRRLTHPEEMGNLFKVLALVPQGHALPPGTE
ncbi:class I SAM-dependent methyltransferase [Falsihalocynthiibacter sp. SS001]|uniref:class I SAM-dependent methyltransferase n=1 Tax=Falsihalocynthiibacter sp. SS001 TaxID=3349698 RepID=UPI0036D21E96